MRVEPDPGVPLLERPLVYVTGKGGAGRTTVALALALLAARAGRRTCLVEVHGQDRVPRLFGRAGLPAGREQPLRPGLTALTLDPRQALAEWFASIVHSRRLVALLVGSATFGQFAEAAPGGQELATMAKLWELSRPRRWTRRPPYDVVVVDAPASGHGLAMLGTPATFADIAPIGPLGRQAEVVRDFVADREACALVVVAQPSELSVAETLQTRDRAPRPLDVVVVDGVLPRRFSAAEVERVAAAVAARGRAAELRAAERVVRLAADRADAQRAQLRRLRAEAGVPVHALPFLPRADLALADVEALADRLGRALAGG